MLPEPNLAVYEQPDIVERYLHQKRLWKAELQLFSLFADDYKDKNVLDIGIGAGRTTPPLAAPAGRYYGIDYSKAMVLACRQKFGNLANCSFEQDDARELASCGNASYDTAFFSFNGIDTIDMEGREAVLDAVRRVLKPGGVFVFSFHSTNALDTVYRYHWQKNPFRWPANYRSGQQIRKLNGPKEPHRQRDWFFLKDGAEDFRIDICYMRPSYQQQMLAAHGFQLHQCFETLTGKDVKLTALDRSASSWLYFRCRAI